MNNLEEAWKKRQADKFKPSKYFREIARKNQIAITKNSPLTSSIFDLITPEMKLKLNKI